MELPPLLPGRFVKRDNRFRVTVEVEGEPVAAHLPNSGRLTELLTPGRLCWLVGFGDVAGRKTRFDLKLVTYAGVLVSVDARLPNSLLAEALAAGRLEPFAGYTRVEREVRLGESRIDFRLSGPEGICWVEVKSVTLVDAADGVARFPDAPTARGARHLRELTAVARGENQAAGMQAAGVRSAAVFVVQRPDACSFAPHDWADPAFGVALREADRAGVGVYAWVCDVSQQAIEITQQIPVVLE